MKFYAAILLAADRKPFVVRIGGEERAYTALVIKPGTKFVFTADDIEYVCIFVEPTHPSFGGFRSVPATGLQLDREVFANLDELLDEAYRGGLSRTHAVSVFEDVIRLACATIGPQSIVDTRVAKALRVLSTSSESSLDELARAVGISYYRLSHLFAENLGITLRQFLQWKKVTVTASLLMIKSITEVAHDAGFSDSAHLSRTFQDIFGVSPSYLLDSNCVERFFYL
jgi:AraC-like DNA-binding protein